MTSIMFLMGREATASHQLGIWCPTEAKTFAILPLFLCWTRVLPPRKLAEDGTRRTHLNSPPGSLPPAAKAGHVGYQGDHGGHTEGREAVTKLRDVSHLEAEDAEGGRSAKELQALTWEGGEGAVPHVAAARLHWELRDGCCMTAAA